MKNTLFFLLAFCMVYACKSKKAVTTVNTEPTDSQLTAIRSKMPEATMEDLKKGHDIFYGPCTNCHGVKDVTGMDESRLKKVMNKMSTKAALTEPEREAVWKYALALNLEKGSK